VILRCEREKVASPRSCISVSRGADWYGYALHHAPGQEDGWRGSVAAALQTLQHGQSGREAVSTPVRDGTGGSR
jgi:hypothetical protein